MPTTALINQMAIFYTSELDFQILHMLFVCWQLMRYLYLCKIKIAGSNENYSSACSLWGLVFKVKQYEAALFFALLRCRETELCCYRLPPADPDGSLRSVGLLLPLDGCASKWPRYTALLPPGTAVKLLSWDLEAGEDLLDLYVCRHLTVTHSLVLTSQAMLFSRHPGLGERDVAWCVETDVDLIYDITETWKRQSPKRSNNLMFTNVMKSSFDVHVSTCHALK